jgi:hypothetical protein
MSKPGFENLFDEHIKNSFSQIVADRTGSGLDRNLQEQRIAQIERAKNDISLKSAFVNAVEGVASTCVMTQYKTKLTEILNKRDIGFKEAVTEISNVSAEAKANPLLSSEKQQAEIGKTEKVFAKTILPTIARTEQNKQRDVFLQNLETGLNNDFVQIGYLYGACNGLEETDPLYLQNKEAVIDKVAAMRNALNQFSLPKDVKSLFERKINKSLFDIYCDQQFTKCKSLSEKLSFTNHIKSNNGIASLFPDGQCQFSFGKIPFAEKIAAKNRFLATVRQQIDAEANRVVSDYIKTKQQLFEGFDLTNPDVCDVLDDYFKDLCSRVTGDKDADYKKVMNLYLTQTGFVPKSMQNTIANLAVADIKDDKGNPMPQAFVLGNEMLQYLLDNKDLKFGKGGFFQQYLGSLVYLRNLVHRFDNPEAAIKKYQDSLLPNPERAAQYAKSFPALVDTEGFKSSLAHASARCFGDEVLDVDVADTFNAETQQKVKEYYCKTGDLESALDAAFLYQKHFGSYGISKVGTANPRLMKYAPELYYKTPFVSADDMAADFDAFVKIAYPNGECFLRADKTTLNEINEGKNKPTYGVFTYDNFDNECPLLDEQNMPVRVGENVFGRQEDDIGFATLKKELKTLKKLRENKAFDALP